MRIRKPSPPFLAPKFSGFIEISDIGDQTVSTMELSTYDHAIDPRWQDVSNIPSTRLQRTMLAVLIFWTLFALAAYCLRMYSRVRNKQLGSGEHHSSLPTESDWLIWLDQMIGL